MPGNDDSMRTIDLIVRELCDAVRKGKEGRATSAGDSPMAEGERAPRGEGPSDGDRGPRRRSSRSQFRASSSDAVAATEAPAEGA